MGIHRPARRAAAHATQRIKTRPTFRTPSRERTDFNAGIEAVRQMVLTTAVTIVVRDDASRVRQQAAVAALQALAEGARDLMLRDEDEEAGG
jgi:hypothetical protein